MLSSDCSEVLRRQGGYVTQGLSTVIPCSRAWRHVIGALRRGPSAIWCLAPGRQPCMCPRDTLVQRHLPFQKVSRHRDITKMLSPRFFCEVEFNL